MKLLQSFYLDQDVVALSRNLLGKYLFTQIDGLKTGGIIVETEAYNGITDKASHAYGNRRTSRTETMYSEGGVAYVYLCYGIHHLFNIVTSLKDDPRAVLIRAIEPVEGIDIMMERRSLLKMKPAITLGPGSLARALGITKTLNALSLVSDTIWLEDNGLNFPDSAIAAVPRVGVDYAGEDAILPYRFYVKGNPYVSKPYKGPR